MIPLVAAGIVRERGAQGAIDGIAPCFVGVAVFRDRKLLEVRRTKHDCPGGRYELPDGGVESGETFAECVARQLRSRARQQKDTGAG